MVSGYRFHLSLLSRWNNKKPLIFSSKLVTACPVRREGKCTVNRQVTTSGSIKNGKAHISAMISMLAARYQIVYDEASKHENS